MDFKAVVLYICLCDIFMITELVDILQSHDVITKRKWMNIEGCFTSSDNSRVFGTPAYSELTKLEIYFWPILYFQQHKNQLYKAIYVMAVILTDNNIIHRYLRRLSTRNMQICTYFYYSCNIIINILKQYLCELFFIFNIYWEKNIIKFVTEFKKWK